MWDFSIAKALGLMIRTAPFLIFRASVHFGIAVAMVVVTGAGAGTCSGPAVTGGAAGCRRSAFGAGAAAAGFSSPRFASAANAL